SAAGAAGTATAAPVPSDPAPLRHLLIEARAAEDRTYYDEAADAAAREAYYATIPQNANPRDLCRHPSRLVTQTPQKQLPYTPATQLYPWVDRQPDHSIRSLYTAEQFDLEELIREDFRRAEEVARRLEALRASESALSEEAFEERADALEAQFPYNCEHVVP